MSTLYVNQTVLLLYFERDRAVAMTLRQKLRDSGLSAQRIDCQALETHSQRTQILRHLLLHPVWVPIVSRTHDLPSMLNWLKLMQRHQPSSPMLPLMLGYHPSLEHWLDERDATFVNPPLDHPLTQRLIETHAQRIVKQLRPSPPKLSLTTQQTLPHYLSHYDRHLSATLYHRPHSEQWQQAWVDLIATQLGARGAVHLDTRDNTLTLSSDSSISVQQAEALYQQHRPRVEAQRQQHHVFAYRCDQQSDERCIFCQNLSTNPNSVLFFIAPAQAITDFLVDLIAHVWHLLEQQISIGSQRAHAYVHDRLRERYHCSSGWAREQRLSIFCHRVQQITVHYEAIHHFDCQQQTHHIWAWEALARDRHNARLPKDVFDTISLWDEEFQRVFDQHILDVALLDYSRQQHLDLQRAPPLCINLYPSTLLGACFEPHFHSCLKRSGLSGRQVILEISEKALIKHGKGYDAPQDLQRLRDRIAHLRQRFGVRFAIDDFGAGHSALPRLFQLGADIVKVDREVVSEHNAQPRQFVLGGLDNCAPPAERAFSIVIEGLDAECHTQPRDVLNRESPIHLVQGHHFSRAQAKIQTRMAAPFYRRIRKLLAWS